MGAMRVRLALGSALAWTLAAGSADARPLDLSDPTPRPIQVEFEVSLDPLAVGQTWSPPYAATYSATGNTGTVVISPSVYESAVDTHNLDYFGVLMGWAVVPGSTTEFRLAIDLTTREAVAQPAF